MIEDVARKYIGINEADNSYRMIIDRYNMITPLPMGYKMNYNDAWCMAFVSVCAKEDGIVDFPYECSCKRFAEKSKSHLEENGVIGYGDIILYDWNNNGIPDHVGIVESINCETITVIEGNFDNCVKRRYINSSDKRICGVYDFTSVSKVATTEDIAKQVIAGKWGNGDYRYDALSLAGYDPVVIQNRVNELMKSSYDNIVDRVIKGEFGNMPERKLNVESLGYSYEEIQYLVNQKMGEK